MIIGLVLLGCVTVLLIFGIAQRVFMSFGVAYWLAFMLVGVMIASAFIPSFTVNGARISASGFLVPLAVAGVFLALALRTREAGHSAVAASAVLAVFLAVELLLFPIASEGIIAVTEGVLCGVIAYIVGKTKLASLFGVFMGVPIGVVAAEVVKAISYGRTMQLGSAHVFDCVVIAAVLAIVISETVAAVKRFNNAKRKLVAETAEEFDPDEYKKYFDE